MPQLSNTRWELFAVGLASGKTRPEAYENAGFNRSSANASTLAKRPEIMDRVAELIEQRSQFKTNYATNSDFEHLGAVEQAMLEGNVTKEWVIKELMDNVKMAREAGQFAASNGALKMLGEEIGMFGGTKPAEADKEKTTNALPPVSVDAINRLLAHQGYTGPLIELPVADEKIKVK